MLRAYAFNRELQKKIDATHDEIQRVREEGGDTTELARALQQLNADFDERRKTPDARAVWLGGVVVGSFEGLVESQILRRDQRVFSPFLVFCQNPYVPTASLDMLLYYRRFNDGKPTQHPYTNATRTACLGGGKGFMGPVGPQILRRGRQVFTLFSVFSQNPFTPAVGHDLKMISSEIEKIEKQIEILFCKKGKRTTPLAGTGRGGRFSGPAVPRVLLDGAQQEFTLFSLFQNPVSGAVSNDNFYKYYYYTVLAAHSQQYKSSGPRWRRWSPDGLHPRCCGAARTWDMQCGECFDCLLYTSPSPRD